MPAEVKILVEGFTSAGVFLEASKEKTQSTVTLVRDGDLVMVVDPGCLESQRVLVDALKKEKLKVKDVNVVCVTHSHVDHYRNIGMFPDAKILEFFGLWDKNTVEDWHDHFTDNIRILRTPGHDYTGISFLVTTGSESQYPGVVAICGDIFWKENYPQSPHEDVYASDVEKLEKSREEVLKSADWIVPGHGGIFRNHRDDFASAGTSKSSKKIFGICKNCHKVMLTKHDSCRCRSWLCHHCCQCGLDCDLCGCSHMK